MVGRGSRRAAEPLVVLGSAGASPSRKMGNSMATSPQMYNSPEDKNRRQTESSDSHEETFLQGLKRLFFGPSWKDPEDESTAPSASPAEDDPQADKPATELKLVAGLEGNLSDDEPFDDWDEEGMPLAPEMTQRITRSNLPDGGEAIYGYVRVSFDADRRLQRVHLGFCPPMETTPSLLCEPMDGPDVTVRQCLVEPFGARLDVKLKQPVDEPTDVILFFSASTGQS